MRFEDFTLRIYQVAQLKIESNSQDFCLVQQVGLDAPTQSGTKDATVFR